MSKTDALRVQDYLAHIVEAIDRMGRYVVDMVELSFLSDEKTQDAVVRNFEILGEAANNIKKASPRLCPGPCRCAVGADVHHAQPGGAWLFQGGL